MTKLCLQLIHLIPQICFNLLEPARRTFQFSFGSSSGLLSVVKQPLSVGIATLEVCNTGMALGITLTPRTNTRRDKRSRKSGVEGRELIVFLSKQALEFEIPGIGIIELLEQPGVELLLIRHPPVLLARVKCCVCRERSKENAKSGRGIDTLQTKHRKESKEQSSDRSKVSFKSWQLWYKIQIEASHFDQI